MARRGRRSYPYGGARRRDASLAPTCGDETIHCNLCNRDRPRRCFFWNVLDRYEKKRARGELARTICKDCCTNSTNAGAIAGPDPRPGAAPSIAPLAPIPAPVFRGSCTRCWIEYPLSIDFFPKGDIKLNAEHRRTCYRCRNEEIIDDATAKLPAALAHLVQAEEEEDFSVCVDESDEDPLGPRAPVKHFEDLDPQQKAEARLAKRLTGRLITKVVSPFSLAERRLRPVYLRTRAEVKQEQEEQQCLRLLIVEAAMPDQLFAQSHVVAYDYSSDISIPHEPDLDLLMEGPSLQAISLNLPLLGTQQIDNKNDSDPSEPGSDSDQADSDDELALALTRLTLAYMPESERLDRLEQRQALQRVEARDLGVSQTFTANVQRAIKEETEALTRLVQRRSDDCERVENPLSSRGAQASCTYSQHLLLETAARTLAPTPDPRATTTPVPSARADYGATAPMPQPFKRAKLEAEACEVSLRSLSP